MPASPCARSSSWGYWPCPSRRRRAGSRCRSEKIHMIKSVCKADLASAFRVAKGQGPVLIASTSGGWPRSYARNPACLPGHPTTTMTAGLDFKIHRLSASRTWRRGSRCDEKTCKSELDRFARKDIDPGLAEIISSREGEAALPSLLVPKALTHGIL